MHALRPLPSMTRRVLLRLRSATPLLPLLAVLAVLGVIGAGEAILAPPPPQGCCAATTIVLPRSPVLSTTAGPTSLTILRPAMYAARLTYSSAAKLQFAAFVVALLGGVILGLQLLPPMRLTRRIVLLLTIALVGAVSAYAAISPALTPATTLRVSQTVAIECGSVPHLNLMLDRMTMALAFFLTIIAGSALARPRGALSVRLRRLAAGHRAITMILALSTIFLAVSIFRVTALGRWVESYYPDESVARDIRVLFDSVIQTWGIYFSMMLAAVYVPSTLLLRWRIAHAAHGLPSGTPPNWLDPSWLKTSYTQELTRVLAVLAPFLAGQAADLLRIG